MQFFEDKRALVVDLAAGVGANVLVAGLTKTIRKVSKEDVIGAKAIKHAIGFALARFVAMGAGSIRGTPLHPSGEWLLSLLAWYLYEKHALQNQEGEILLRLLTGYVVLLAAAKFTE